MSDESDRTPRVKSRRSAPIARGSRAQEEEEVDDPATVLAHSAGRQLRHLRMEPEEDAEDARTVRVSRMPVSFIGESVTDPTTAMDTSEAASRWREFGNVDEIDPTTDPHSLDAEPPKRTPEPAVHTMPREPEIVAPPVADEPAISTIVISLLLGAVLGVGAVAITALLLF